jgi:hypothetical protein
MPDNSWLHITDEELAAAERELQNTPQQEPLDEQVIQRIKKRFLLKILEDCKWHKSIAAYLLKMSLADLEEEIRKHNIIAP